MWSSSRVRSHGGDEVGAPARGPVLGHGLLPLALQQLVVRAELLQLLHVVRVEV